MRHPKLPAEQAWLYYASLPPDQRSRAAVAAHFGVARSTVGALMAKGRWVERIRELEGQAMKKATETLKTTLEERAVEHIRDLRFIQQKAMAALRDMPIASWPEGAKFLLEAIKLERVCLGEPDKKTEASLEVVLKNGLEQWLERPGERRGKIRVLNDEGEVVDAEFEEVSEPAALPAPADDEEGRDDA